MQNYFMTVVMAVHKRCAASGSRVCSERNTICKNAFAANFAKSKQIMHEKQFAVMNSLHYLKKVEDTFSVNGCCLVE